MSTSVRTVSGWRYSGVGAAFTLTGAAGEVLPGENGEVPPPL